MDYYTKHLESLRSKWNLKGLTLELEGGAPHPIAKTVQEFVNEKETKDRKQSNMKLALGFAEYQDKEVSMALEVRHNSKFKSQRF
jgi:hypothetical protein